MDISYKELNTFNSPFLCIARDGNLFDTQGNHIGVSIAKHKEALDLLKDYKSLLEKHGIIKPVKTPAEIQAETQASLATLTEMVQSLTNKIEKLEAENDKQRSGNGNSKSVQRESKP